MKIAIYSKAYEQISYKLQDYIESNLDKSLNLKDLSKIAHFSPFHTHRIFKLITSETPYDFIQRVRLERSSAMLSANMDTKIIHIALSCGFSNASSFSKAFKQHFGCSPSFYRSNQRHFNNRETHDSKNGTLVRKKNKATSRHVEYSTDQELEKLHKTRRNMNATIENISSYRIAYMRQIGPYGPNNIQLMQRFKKWAITRDLLDEKSIILGIAHDNPSVTPANNCRYDCGIVLTDTYELEKEMNETRLSGGKYAVFSVDYSIEAIRTAWDEILSIWLPQSGYQLDSKPLFERYSDSSIGIQPDVCEICIPLK
ncbi:AraC family transcriptional regulator [Puniceicoccaceae bacterium K14]|nr:AraC family transcriptional regulator [Puniceicoccaceae bacterium K14]